MRLFFLAAITMALTTRAAAQGAPAAHICGDTASYGSSLLEDVTAIVTGTDHESVEARNGKVPRMSASDVSYVTDDSICGKALDAYVTRQESGATLTRVYVVRAGNFYFVANPDTDEGDGVDVEVFDKVFKWVMAVED